MTDKEAKRWEAWQALGRKTFLYRTAVPMGFIIGFVITTLNILFEVYACTTKWQIVGYYLVWITGWVVIELIINIFVWQEKEKKYMKYLNS